MPSPIARHRWAVGVLPAVIATAGVGVALRTNAWSWWGVAAMAPKTTSPTSFADLANVTATAQCISRGWDYTACDPYGRLFQPYVVLPARLLAALGLDMGATPALGLGLAGLYVIGVLVLGLSLAGHWPASTAGLVGAALVLGLGAISPPAMLAVERGQIELLAFALVAVALALLPARRGRWRAVGGVAAAAAVVVKPLCLGALAPILQRRRPSLAAAAALVVAVTYVLLSWSDVVQASRAARTTEPGTARTQFGAVSLPATWLTGDPIRDIPDQGVVSHWGFLLVVSGIVTVVGVAVAALLLRRAGDGVDAVPVARWLITGGTGILLPVYVIGLAHDYRLVFLLPVLAGLLLWAASASGRDRVLPLALAGCALTALVTGAAMVADPAGFLLPRAGLLVGDAALFVLLAAGGGLWLTGLVRRGR